MRILVLISLSISMLLSNASPCDDELYLELKNKNINQMSDREYEYFTNKDKQCNEHSSFKNNVNKNLGHDKIADLKSRQRTDLLGFLVIWAVTIGVDAAVSDGMTTELLVPGIGPFIIDDPSEDYEIALYLSGIVQTAFLADYFQTSSKINRLENKLSYSVNPNPANPSVTVSYHFK